MTRYGDVAPFLAEVEHTADAGFVVVAPNVATLFERAALGVVGLVADPGGAVEQQTKHITLRADALVDLLHDFLTEVLLLMLVEGFLIVGVDVVAVDDTSLEARVAVDDGRALRSMPYQEVKAITYHELAVERRDDGWSARVIVDI